MKPAAATGPVADNCRSRVRRQAVMGGDVPSTPGRVIGLALALAVCVVGAVAALAGHATGSSISTVTDYLAVPFVVILAFLLVREIRRLW
jgi:hypothetical protein